MRSAKIGIAEERGENGKKKLVRAFERIVAFISYCIIKINTMTEVFTGGF